MSQSQETKESSSINDFFMRMGILGELLACLWKRKLHWLIPMMLTFLHFAVIIILANSSALSVFIYPIF